MTERYGIRVTYVCWATEDGGTDLVGTREEMAAIIAKWREENGDPSVTYEVALYPALRKAGVR